MSVIEYYIINKMKFIRLTNKIINVNQIKTITKENNIFNISVASNGTNIFGFQIGKIGYIIGHTDEFNIRIEEETNKQDYKSVSEFFDMSYYIINKNKTIE